MSRRARFVVFGAGVAGLVPLLAWGMAGLPDFGSFSGQAADLITRIGVPERKATNVVATTTFDIRGIDTLGEELILLAAALGVLVVLRISRGDAEIAAEPGERRPTAASPTVAAVLTTLAPAMLVFGLYIVTHGHLTPGGGFQGGVLLAAAAVFVYLGGNRLRHGRTRPIEAAELTESLGAAAYAVIAIGGLVFAGACMENFLPLGVPGNLLSAGTIPLLNLAVGIEVLGSMLLILGELLDQRMLEHGRKAS
jgi:multicomponent Na+:H+ antiporter subunit B